MTTPLPKPAGNNAPIAAALTNLITGLMDYHYASKLLFRDTPMPDSAIKKLSELRDRTRLQIADAIEQVVDIVEAAK